MNAKKYLVAAIILSTVAPAFAASDCQHPACETRRNAKDFNQTALAGPGKFGPVIETILPDAGTDRSVEMVDLETGRALVQPPIEYFNSRAEAIMGWIRSNGLDISCFLMSGGGACVTYDMTVVPVDGKCWEQTTEQELLANPALAPVRHSPRKLLVVGQNRPDTYIFRTAEGTAGMLRLVGVGQQERGVKVRYKLINPTKSVAATGSFESVN